MARTWPFQGWRARATTQVIGQVVLGALLVLTLAFSGRDGTPSIGYKDSVGHTLSGTALFGQTIPSIRNLSDWTTTTEMSVSAKVLIPKAPPVQLLIPSLDIHRPVEAVGVDRSGVMKLPVNFWNAGWFKGSPVPGAPGDAVIEGHAGYPGQPLIFGRLVALRPGDHVTVVLADGTRRLFKVESMTRVPVGTAPPGMAEPYGPPRLTLITCTGHFDQGRYSYSQRLVLEASYAGLA